MKKVPSVMQVQVSLNGGLTILDLKPGNATTMADLRRIIKNNGFVSKEATVVARGAATADQKTFLVDGTNEQLPTGTYCKGAGQTVDAPEDAIIAFSLTASPSTW